MKHPTPRPSFAGVRRPADSLPPAASQDNVRPKGCVNVVVMTRLVWRKGTHLLVEIVPEVCRRFPYVHFIIGGDGPNRTALEEMRERHHLQVV